MLRDGPLFSYTTSRSRPLGILGRCHPCPPTTGAHHRSDPPPTILAPNSTSAPRRLRISQFINNTWMGTTWVDSLHRTETANTTTAHPRRIHHRARMATPSGIHTRCIQEFITSPYKDDLAKMISQNWTWNIVDWCAWLWARLLTPIGHRHGTISCMDGTTEYRYCRTTLDCNLGLSHA